MSAASEGTLDERKLARLLEVGSALVSELDQEEVFHRVLGAARELTGAQYAALGVLDEAKQELERFLVLGIDEETRAKIGPLPTGQGLLGELIRDPKPLRLASISDHPRSYGFPAHHPPMTTFLGVPVMVRGEVFGNLYLTEKEGGDDFDEADEELLGVLSGWAAVAIANARLYEEAENRRVELERAVRGLRATASLNAEIGAGTDVRRVFELVVKRGRALVEARACILLLAEDHELMAVDAAGEVSADLIGHSVAVETPILESVVHGSGGQRLAAASRGAWSALGLDAAHALVSPLRSRGESRGVLMALDRLGADGGFTADDELLFTSFAATAATAVADVRAIEAQKRELSISASEQERRRWARELHDETLQELSAIKMQQESAVGSDEPAHMRAALERSAVQVRGVIEGLEALITELRPAALDELGPAAAVEALVAQIAARSELEIDLAIDLAWERGDAETRHTAELEATIYRIVQEALANVIKHAGAGRAWVSIIEDGEAVTVTIEDDGSGFGPKSERQGFGLVGMRERVELAQGELEITSRRGGGSCVRVRLPVARSSSPAGRGSGTAA